MLYIWKQGGFGFFFLFFFFWLFALFYLTHFFLSQQKLIFWQLLTAFDIIHFIYKIVHNIYLTSIALKTMICTVKQPTTANRKGWHKRVCSRFISLLSWLDILPVLVVLIGPRSKQSIPKRARRASAPICLFPSPSPCESPWSSWIYCRWSKLCKRTQSQAKCPLTCQTGHMRRAPRRQNFLFQSNSAGG